PRQQLVFLANRMSHTPLITYPPTLYESKMTRSDAAFSPENRGLLRDRGRRGAGAKKTREGEPRGFHITILRESDAFPSDKFHWKRLAIGGRNLGLLGPIIQ